MKTIVIIKLLICQNPVCDVNQYFYSFCSLILYISHLIYGFKALRQRLNFVLCLYSSQYSNY